MKKSVVLTVVVIGAILVLLTAIAIFFMVLQSNRTIPKLKEQCKVDFGNYEITDVASCGDGFLCVLNGNEIRVIDPFGETVSTMTVNGTVTAVSVYDETSYKDVTRKRMELVIDGKLLECYNWSEEAKEYVKKAEFYTDKNIVSLNAESGYLVLDQGDLYRISAFQDGAAPEAELLRHDVKLVAGEYAVLNDNSVCRLSDGKSTAPLGREIIGIADSASTMVYTADELYAVDANQELMKLHDISDGQVYVHQEGYFYISSGKCYYTGLLAGKARGKGIPEADNKPLELPQGLRYCAIYHGAVCYDGHTLTCYNV